MLDFGSLADHEEFSEREFEFSGLCGVPVVHHVSVCAAVAAGAGWSG